MSVAGCNRLALWATCASVLGLGIAQGLRAEAGSAPRLVLARAEVPQAVQDRPEAPPRERRFLLEYGAKLTGLAPGARVRVWLPVAPSNQEQEVELVEQSLPAQGRRENESKYGNELLHFETTAPAAGSVQWNLRYRVRRVEVRSALAASAEARSQSLAADTLSAQQRLLFLRADAKGPITGKPLELLRGLRLEREPLGLSRQLYERVGEHMTYKKEGVRWGQGDVLWACDSGYGNCTDFHSLFISLARSQGVPARFEIGFPLPTERGKNSIPGYHCWAYFFVDEVGWVPVDISEAEKNPRLKDYYFGNLTADRVTFSVGRDLVLSPPQAGPPLNFLIYPYVEVDGRPYPQNKLQMHYAVEDVVADR